MTEPRSLDLLQPAPDRWWVYLYMTEDHAVAYVGMTGNPEQRRLTHRRRSAWVETCVYTLWDGPFPTRDEALAREKHLIEMHRPVNNVRLNPGRPDTAPVKSAISAALTRAADALRELVEVSG